MMLTSAQKKQFKAQAHTLKPIVFVGNKGLNENVVNEINRGLEDHELIKVRILESDREARKLIFNEICTMTEAEPIQFIGKMGTLFRKSSKNKDRSR